MKKAFTIIKLIFIITIIGILITAIFKKSEDDKQYQPQKIERLYDDNTYIPQN